MQDADCKTAPSAVASEEDRGSAVNIYWNRVIADKDSFTATKGTATYHTVPNFSTTEEFWFYRLAAADFTTLEGAWANTALQCDTGENGGINKMDGRAY